TLVFGPELGATADLIDQMLLYAALITLAIGMIGILGSKGMGRLAAFATIASLGTLLIAISGFNEATTAAAIYYMLHSTLAGALLFLVVDMVRERRGADALVPGPRMAQQGLITALFFGAAIATAGMPPLSGFIGKLLILDAVRDLDAVWLIWAVVLGTSLVAMLGLAQTGSAVFWKPLPDADAAPIAAPASTPPVALPMVAACAILGAIVALSVLAGPVMRYVEATAAQLHAPGGYILPHPFLTLLLIAVWQMLVNTVTIGNLLLGTILALIIPVITSPYWPNRPHLRSALRIAEYVAVVIWDICVANVQVAYIILFKSNADTHSTWITVPLDLRTPEAITVLAGTITLTPGTVSSDLAADGCSLLV
ncbi:MAG: Na+/H+ antiporter subunit E, partial [Gammaproteobacteria bacterium]